MASSTPSAPINSSRGAADTTADLIYFSTPSAQVRVPVGVLVFPTPNFCSHLLPGGKLFGGGKITPRRRRNYPAAELLSRAGAGGPKFRKKFTVPKTVAQCPKYPIPYLYTLSQTMPYLYTLNRNIPYL